MNRNSPQEAGRKDRLRWAIERIKERTGLSQKAIAEKAGVRPDHLSHAKSDDCGGPGLATGLQAAFNINAEWVLYGTGPRELGGSAEADRIREDEPGLDVVFVAKKEVYICDRCWEQLTLGCKTCPKCHGSVDWEHSDLTD